MTSSNITGLMDADPGPDEADRLKGCREAPLHESSPVLVAFIIVTFGLSLLYFVGVFLLTVYEAKKLKRRRKELSAIQREIIFSINNSLGGEMGLPRLSGNANGGNNDPAGSLERGDSAAGDSMYGALTSQYLPLEMMGQLGILEAGESGDASVYHNRYLYERNLSISSEANADMMLRMLFYDKPDQKGQNGPQKQQQQPQTNNNSQGSAPRETNVDDASGSGGHQDGEDAPAGTKRANGGNGQGISGTARRVRRLSMKAARSVLGQVSLRGLGRIPGTVRSGKGETGPNGSSGSPERNNSSSVQEDEDLVTLSDLVRHVSTIKRRRRRPPIGRLGNLPFVVLGPEQLHHHHQLQQQHHQLQQQHHQQQQQQQQQQQVLLAAGLSRNSPKAPIAFGGTVRKLRVAKRNRNRNTISLDSRAAPTPAALQVRSSSGPSSWGHVAPLLPKNLSLPTFGSANPGFFRPRRRMDTSCSSATATESSSRSAATDLERTIPEEHPAVEDSGRSAAAHALTVPGQRGSGDHGSGQDSDGVEFQRPRSHSAKAQQNYHLICGPSCLYANRVRRTAVSFSSRGMESPMVSSRGDRLETFDGFVTLQPHKKDKG